MAESAFQGDYKSDPQGVVTSLGLLSFVDLSSMHPSFSTFYGAPFLAPLSLVLKRGIWGRRGKVVSWFHAPFSKQLWVIFSASVFHGSRMPTVLQF